MSLCRICLRADKLVKVINLTLTEFHDELCNFDALDSPDSLFCVECEYLLKKMYNFKLRCQRAMEIYHNWINEKQSRSKIPLDRLYTLMPKSSLGNWIAGNNKMFMYEEGVTPGLSHLDNVETRRNLGQRKLEPYSLSNTATENTNTKDTNKNKETQNTNKDTIKNEKPKMYTQEGVSRYNNITDSTTPKDTIKNEEMKIYNQVKINRSDIITEDTNSNESYSISDTYTNTKDTNKNDKTKTYTQQPNKNLATKTMIKGPKKCMINIVLQKYKPKIAITEEDPLKLPTPEDYISEPRDKKRISKKRQQQLRVTKSNALINEQIKKIIRKHHVGNLDLSKLKQAIPLKVYPSKEIDTLTADINVRNETSAKMICKNITVPNEKIAKTICKNNVTLSNETPALIICKSNIIVPRKEMAAETIRFDDAKTKSELTELAGTRIKHKSELTKVETRIKNNPKTVTIKSISENKIIVKPRAVIPLKNNSQVIHNVTKDIPTKIILKDALTGQKKTISLKTICNDNSIIKRNKITEKVILKNDITLIKSEEPNEIKVKNETTEAVSYASIQDIKIQLEDPVPPNVESDMIKEEIDDRDLDTEELKSNVTVQNEGTVAPNFDLRIVYGSKPKDVNKTTNIEKESRKRPSSDSISLSRKGDVIYENANRNDAENVGETNKVESEREIVKKKYFKWQKIQESRKEAVRFTKERLKAALLIKFAACGEIKSKLGNDIDKELIMRCLDKKVPETLAKKLWYYLLYELKDRRYSKVTFSPDTLRTFWDIQKRYRNDEMYEEVFDIQYLPTDKEVLEEFQIRKTYPCYLAAEYKCNICYQVFKYAKRLEVHMKAHLENPGDIACDVCGMRFSNEKTFDGHVKSHRAVFKCKLCPLVTYYWESMNNHYEQHKGKVYKCAPCGTTYKSLSAYRTHMATRLHGRVSCTVCGRSFHSLKGLKLHKGMRHKNEVVPPTGESVPCDSCNLSFPSQEVLATHEKYSHGLVPDRPNNIAKRKLQAVSCRICGVEGASNPWLRKHFREKHPTEILDVVYADVKSILCQYCGKGFSTISNLNEHIPLHTRSLPQQCPQCPLRCRNKRALFHHMKYHRTRRELCRVCGRQFLTRASLNNHTKFHNSNRKYKCSICLKAYTHKETVVRHLRRVHKQTEEDVKKNLIFVNKKEEKDTAKNEKEENPKEEDAGYSHKKETEVLVKEDRPSSEDGAREEEWGTVETVEEDTVWGTETEEGDVPIWVSKVEVSYEKD